MAARPALHMLLLGLTVASAGLLPGCDRQVEPYVPGERSQTPDLSRIFPEGADLARQNEAESAPGGGRGAPPVAAETAAPIRGSVVLAPELSDRAPDGGALFVFARHGQAAGPPLAVKRIENPRFPLRFELGPQDRMMTGMPFIGPLRVTARLDADGNATTRTPGDLQGAVAEPVQPGAADVTIVLDQVL